jgi:hypothetical protein
LTLDFSTGRTFDPRETETEPLAALVQRGVFGNVATTKIFIMTPAAIDRDLTGVPSREQGASLLQSDPQPLFDGTQQVTIDRLGAIRTALSGLMPGIPVRQFVYRRQTDDDKLTQAFGKAAVSSIARAVLVYC